MAGAMLAAVSMACDRAADPQQLTLAPTTTREVKPTQAPMPQPAEQTIPSPAPTAAATPTTTIPTPTPPQAAGKTTTPSDTHWTARCPAGDRTSKRSRCSVRTDIRRIGPYLRFASQWDHHLLGRGRRVRGTDRENRAARRALRQLHPNRRRLLPFLCRKRGRIRGVLGRQLFG